MPPAAPNPQVTINPSTVSGDALDTPLWHNKVFPNKLSLSISFSLSQVVNPQHVSLVFLSCSLVFSRVPSISQVSRGRKTWYVAVGGCAKMVDATVRVRPEMPATE